MKILWHGVSAGIKTGYGKQTAIFTPALQQAGHEIRILSVLHQYHNGIDRNGILNYSSGRYELLGNQYAAQHYQDFEPDAVISCVNAFVCRPEIFQSFPWYPFVFSEQTPIIWTEQEVLKSARRPIAPTKTTQEMLNSAGFNPYFVPLAIDCKTFCVQDRAEARRLLSRSIGANLNNKFVVVMNGMNHGSPGRKNYGAALKAWAQFNAHQKNAVLYIHTEATGTQWDGMNLVRMAEQYECRNVYFAPQYEYITGMISDEWLAYVYNAADLFLHTARGEGFGLPIIEAQACGCPVLVPGHGTMQEQAINGHTIEGVITTSKDEADEFIVDEQDVARKLQYCYHMIKTVKQEQWCNRAAISEPVQKFDISNIMTNYMLPVLEDIQQYEQTKKTKESRHRDRPGMQRHTTADTHVSGSRVLR